MRAEMLSVNSRRSWPALLAAALLAYADVQAEGPYATLKTGLARVNSLSGTGTLSWPPLSSSDRNVRTEIEYDDTPIYGFEVGMRRVYDTPFAVALSFDTFQAELEGSTFTASGEVPRQFSSGEIADGNLDFDQRAILLGVSGFFERDMGEQKVYVGAGIAGAFIGNADVAFGPVLHTGLRYEIERLGYVDVRISWFRCDAPPHKATGLQFDKFGYTAITLAVGKDLWQ